MPQTRLLKIIIYHYTPDIFLSFSIAAFVGGGVGGGGGGGGGVAACLCVCCQNCSRSLCAIFCSGNISYPIRSI